VKEQAAAPEIDVTSELFIFPRIELVFCEYTNVTADKKIAINKTVFIIGLF
jgi:hypothetical protein